MECPGCSKSYQEDVCEPYILIGCGHSLCLDCLKDQSMKNELSRGSDASSAIRKFSIECPECSTATQAESLNQFPKNFSLLNMIKSSLTSRTGPMEKDQEMAIRDINNINSKSLMGHDSQQPEGLRQAKDDEKHYQSVSDYNSTVNYDHHRAEFLENLDIHEQVSHSQGGQGDQSGARDYKRSELSKLDPSEQSAGRASLHVREFDNESLSVKRNLQEEQQLLLSQQSSGDTAKQSSKKGQKTKGSDLASSEVSHSNKEEQQSQYECELHGKGIQGYCQTDRQALCIDCILSGIHKNHEICSIDKAARQERDALTVKFQKSQVLQDLINSSLIKGKNHQEQLKNQAVEYKNKIQQIYQELRVLIDEKERSLISEVESKLQKEIKYLNNRDKDGQNQLNVIDQFQSSWNKLGELTDEQLLMNINDSYREAEKALSEPKQIKINQVITKVNKDTEIAQLTKYLLNSASQVNLPMSTGQANTTSSHAQFAATPEVHSAKLKEIEKEQANVADQKQTQARRLTQRRDSNFKVPNFQKQATQRSSSTRPNAFNPGSEPNSSTTVSAAQMQKANYMQATSSWAKRKHENEKQKEEFNTKKTNERNRYQNPKGFTTLGNGQHPTNGQGEWTSKNRDAQSNNLVRNSRLASKDRKITNPFERQQNAIVDKQTSSMQPLGQATNASGGYNSAQKITGSPTNINQTSSDYNPLGKVNKSGKPESSEKKKKGKPALVPQLANHGSSTLKKDSNRHASTIANSQAQRAGTTIAETLPSQNSIVGAQSHTNLSNPSAHFQSQNSRTHLAVTNKSEKLHFLKSKQRMPILKESRANNNSRLGMEPSEKEGAANQNKTQAHMTQRNRSQTRVEEKPEQMQDKANTGASTVPITGAQGRKKQTWQRTNTINNMYLFDQGSNTHETGKINNQKKKTRASNQSVDNDVTSPIKNTAQTYKNSFQRAALEKKKHVESSLRSSQEGKFQSQLLQESTSDEAKYLLNLNGANKAVPQMSSLADKRNEMKNRNNLKTVDALSEMPEHVVDSISPNVNSEIQQLHDQFQQQNDYSGASGFNDTSYTRQIQQISQNISLESKIEQIQKQLESHRLQQEPLCNTTRPAQPELNTIQNTSDTYVNFNNSLQINMAAVKGGTSESHNISYRQPEDRLQSTQHIQSSSAVVAGPQSHNFGQLDGQYHHNGQQDSSLLALVNDRDSLEGTNHQRGQASPRSSLAKEGEQTLQEPKTEHKATGTFQPNAQDESTSGPKQARQRWQTMKKQKSNGEVSGQPRGQSISQVFVDDSQDNINFNNLVPHNDTEYNLQPEDVQINTGQVHQQVANPGDHQMTSDQLLHQEQRASPGQGTAGKMGSGLDLPRKPEDDGGFPAIEASNYSQYTDQQSSRKLDLYPQIQSFAQSKEEYEHIQSSRKIQNQIEREPDQQQSAERLSQQHSRSRAVLDQNFMNEMNTGDNLSNQLLQMNEQIQNLKMSFAPTAAAESEDYKADHKIAGSNNAQMPQTFLSKYQAQLDAQNGNNYKKRGELDDSCLPQEASASDHELTMLKAQLQQEKKKQFSIFAISGYCDQPLQAVERITFKFNGNIPSLAPQQSFSERVNSNFRQEDEESVCGDGPGWQQCAQLNVARTKFEAVVVPENRQAGRIKQQIWILGGKNAQSQRIDVIEMYDESADAWNIIPQIKMRKAKSGFASVLVHHEAKQVDQLMVIGGNDGQVQNRVEFMNLWDYQWHKCASMISRRDELAACLGPDGKIYAIGGYGGPTNSSCLRSVERYDVLKNKWEQVAAMNEGRRALAAVAMPDGIYAIGGYNGKDYISSVEKYDIDTDTWSVVCHLNSPKCTMTAVASPDAQKFYVIGGFNGTQLNEVEVYSTQTRTLRKFTYPMLMKRFMHSSAVLIQ